MPGYSPNPLWKKLGYKPGLIVFVHRAPPAYRAELALPTDFPVHWVRRPAAGAPFIHTFVREFAELSRLVAAYRPLLAPTGVLWISWPKQSAGVPTDLTENRVRDVALPLGLVDIKVCAVDATWSALKFVIRKTLR